MSPTIISAEDTAPPRESTATAKGEQRYPALDGLRAMSILLVLAGHMLPIGPKILQLNATSATMGMSLFFALSGFLIATSLFHNSNIAEFAAKRLGKILPLAILYATVVLIFIRFDLAEYAYTLTFLINYFDQHLLPYNDHLWSLCVEVQFYTAIAIVVLVGGKQAIWIVWPACILITFLRVSEGAYLHIQTHLRVDEILAGACIATLFHHFKRVRQLGALAWLAAALFWFASSSPYSGWLEFTRPYATGVLLATTLCLDPGPIKAVLISRALRYVATISYALYVVHPLSTYGWLHDGGTAIKYLVKRPISLTITFVVAHIATFYFEQPILNAIKRAIRSRRQKNSDILARQTPR